jgi:hypothetical protein
MPYGPRTSTRATRRFAFSLDLLEHRVLLSGTSPGRQDVSIDVPSAYISQQSSQLDVTLVRANPSGRADAKGAITLDFSATSGASASGSALNQFTPVDESVTFPAGQTTETVAVPINSGAANPGLVPIDLAVTSAVRQVKGSSTTVYLASSPDVIPPSIIAVERVAGGIEVTFSKPMDPTTVENIHNYKLKFSPSQNFSLETLYGANPFQTLDTATQNVPLRRATYNPATDTVLLVATEQLGSKGSYKISSPASLLAKKARPGNAHPLTDSFGNVLDEGGRDGSFSITIHKGKPYSIAQPTLAYES